MNERFRDRVDFYQDAVLINKGLICVDAGWYKLRVNADSCLRNMALNDFKKMLRVVGRLIEPEAYAYYLHRWLDALDDDSYYIRRAKIYKIIESEMNNLPEDFWYE